MPCYGKSGILIYTLKLAWGRNLNKPSLMPPWWVYKNHGERSDLRLAFFFSCLSYLATDSICVGLVSDFSQSHFPAYCCLGRSFYQVLVIVQRDGVEPNSFAVKLRSHQFACLSCRSPGRRPERLRCRYDFNVVEWY